MTDHQWNLKFRCPLTLQDFSLHMPLHCINFRRCSCKTVNSDENGSLVFYSAFSLRLFCSHVKQLAVIDGLTIVLTTSPTARLTRCIVCSQLDRSRRIRRWPADFSGPLMIGPRWAFQANSGRIRMKLECHGDLSTLAWHGALTLVPQVKGVQAGHKFLCPDCHMYSRVQRCTDKALQAKTVRYSSNYLQCL